ncbi:phosphorylase family protein [Frigoriglobus tundricola]|uniref:Nucleoside phosphorylase domain-containing protein n=1 Tax=Frigoriglobus tundricola TaxID=2774151 RepID=A0A6M5YXE6_9BACT|nr:hypothetical protein [Frigoriglobus tundricola]QJW98669.1 hypothetical protein FTUN_6264 [Frigoriglobus tundricola]
MSPSEQALFAQILEELDAFALESAQGTSDTVLLRQFHLRWRAKFGSQGEMLALRVFTIRHARDEGAPMIAIITALPKEFAAVECLLDAVEDIAIPGCGAGRRYTRANLSATSGGSHKVVLALMADMGNNIAAIRAALLLEHFPTVEAIIMTGIAGGIPHPAKLEDHVRLGDIVVSNRNGVVQYDNLKSGRKGKIVVDTVRAAPRPPAAKLLEAVRYLEARALRGVEPWHEHIDRACQSLNIARPSAETDVLHHSTNRQEVITHPDDTRRKPGRPLIFQGPIAAANILLKDPVRRDRLRDAHGVKAVEMEGSGIADATWHADNGYLVVRGICDYCDMSKDDAWQAYAAAIAAAYTIALIASMPATEMKHNGH